MDHMKMKKFKLSDIGRVDKDKDWKRKRSIERKYKIKLQDMSHQKSFVSKLKLIA